MKDAGRVFTGISAECAVTLCPLVNKERPCK